MNSLIKIHKSVLLACAAAAAITILAVGCSTVEIDRSAARQQLAYVLKTAYAYGGAEAVSNKIESLVVDGKLNERQAAQLHALAQKVYEDAVAHLEEEVAESDLAVTAGN